jgi:hypothetical protein
MAQKFENSSFICSDSNSMHSKSDKKAMEQIVNNEKFNARFLFATKVLDNGINIKDAKVKNIIIDMLDPISFIQCLGRKRCEDEYDTINLYVKNYHGGNLFFMVNEYNRRIDQVVELQEVGMQEFRNRYRKTNFDTVIDNDYNINIAKYYHYMTQRKLFIPMLANKNKTGYKTQICDMLGFSVDAVKDGDIQFEKVSLKTLLEKYLDVKMFEEEREKFKNLFFNSIFTSKRTDYVARGIKAARGVIEEDNLPFMISSRQETKGEYRNKSYWIIEEKK